VFLTIYICTINLLLLFDNTTGMTHLKTVPLFLLIFLGAFAKLGKGTISFVMSVRLFVRMEHSVPTERIVMKFNI